MKDITVSSMLKAGVHFGHKTSKWNPKMKPYIYQSREKVHIIDIRKTKKMLEKALGYVAEVVKKDGKIIFVGTKKQAKEIVEKAAKDCGMPYITERWLGGTFTNFEIIKKRIARMLDMEEKEKSDDFKKYTKKEQIKLRKELEKLQKNIGGLRSLQKLPECVFVIDAVDNKLVIKEAKAKKIPVIALADTNSNPDVIDHIIPANDDAIKSIELLVNAVAEKIKTVKK